VKSESLLNMLSLKLLFLSSKERAILSRNEGEVSLGFIFLEKFSGFVLLIVGIILSYYTHISRWDLGEAAAFFFMVVGILLVFLGLLLIIAKIE